MSALRCSTNSPVFEQRRGALKIQNRPTCRFAKPQQRGGTLKPWRNCNESAVLSRRALWVSKSSSEDSRSNAPSSSNSSPGQQGEEPVNYNKEFGYSRKDIILIGVGLIGLGYGLYYGLQAMGMDAGIAGNWVQFTIFMGICVGWISSYLFRVATKRMTYVKQLEDYEQAVMQKRLEEMTEDELGQLVEDAESSKKKMGRK